MIYIRTERRIFYAVMYFVIACVIAAALIGCSPYANPVEKIQQGTPTPRMTATVTTVKNPSVGSFTPTRRPSCIVSTGYDAGRVNLRRDATRNSAAIDVLREGERLTILRAGDWMNVSTREGIAGFIYSRYCK